MNVNQRLDKLERDTRQDQQQPTYISVDVETWESGDLKLDRPVKVYIGISPDDWDQDEQGQKCPKKKDES